MKLVDHLDANRLELRQAAIENLAAPPGSATSPVVGQVYYDTTLKKLGIYDGTTWIYKEKRVDVDDIQADQDDWLSRIVTNFGGLMRSVFWNKSTAVNRQSDVAIMTGATPYDESAILGIKANGAGLGVTAFLDARSPSTPFSIDYSNAGTVYARYAGGTWQSIAPFAAVNGANLGNTLVTGLITGNGSSAGLIRHGLFNLNATATSRIDLAIGVGVSGETLYLGGGGGLQGSYLDSRMVGPHVFSKFGSPIASYRAGLWSAIAPIQIGPLANFASITNPVAALHIDGGVGAQSYLKFTQGGSQLAINGCDIGISPAGVFELRSRDGNPIEFYVGSTLGVRLTSGATAISGQLTITPATVTPLTAVSQIPAYSFTQVSIVADTTLTSNFPLGAGPNGMLMVLTNVSPFNLTIPTTGMTAPSGATSIVLTQNQIAFFVRYGPLWHLISTDGTLTNGAIVEFDFTTSIGFYPPVWAKRARGSIFGAGASGGTGRMGALGTARSGGSGGSGGGRTDFDFDLKTLGLTVGLTNGLPYFRIPAALGGASVIGPTTPDTNGLPGLVGTPAQIFISTDTTTTANLLVVAAGGVPGLGGTSVAVAGGNGAIGGNALWPGGNGGQSTVGGTTNPATGTGGLGGVSSSSAGGGGGGGGLSATNAYSVGGNGGVAANARFGFITRLNQVGSDARAHGIFGCPGLGGGGPVSMLSPGGNGYRGSGGAGSNAAPNGSPTPGSGKGGNAYGWIEWLP